MNDPILDEAAIAASDPRVELQNCVRSNPTGAVLFAIGAGLAIGLLVRALRPEPTPSQKVANLVAEIEERLRDAAAPTFRRAGALASNGADVLRDRLQGSEARIERLLREATRGFRSLFHR
jgi:ElaB/YqjD/DUF883 family membrane-anchored ribosome-binding protein